MRALCIALAGTLLAGLCFAAPASAQSAEAAIAKVRSDLAKECDGKIRFKPGFQKEADVNGDGRPDYFLDYGEADCVGGSSVGNAFCGSAGCVLDILVSGPGGYRNGWGDNVRGWSIDQVGGKPVLAIDSHGSACGKSGASACKRRFTWNGAKFVPMGRR